MNAACRVCQSHRPSWPKFRRVRACVPVLFATIFAAPLVAAYLPAQPTEPQAATTPSQNAEAAWSQRLTALDPADPSGYLMLGEEVADAAETPDEESLARRLFFLAFELDRRVQPSSNSAAPASHTAPNAAADAPASIAASACIALASLSRAEQEIRWLRELAATADPRYARAAWSPVADEWGSDEDRLAAAEVFGHLRAGEGDVARTLLARPLVRAAIDHLREISDVQPQFLRLEVLDRQATLSPCTECRNARVVRRVRAGGGGAGGGGGGAGAQVEYRPCPLCQGNPGLTLSEAELLQQLRAESLLLRGDQKSWGAQIATDYGSPLLDVDFDEFRSRFARFDPQLTIWRSGVWTKPSSPAANVPVSTPPVSIPSAAATPSASPVPETTPAPESSPSSQPRNEP